MSINQKHFGLSDSLVNAVNEALKGNQHKIDANKNGKIDAQDFKKLRGEGAKPDFIDLDKDGNKKEPMKHAAKQAKEEVEQVDEISDTTLKSYRTKAMQHRMGHQPGDSAEVKADRNRKTRNRSQGVRTSWNKMIGRYVKVGGNNKKTYEETEVTEADDAVSKQIAAKKDAMQKQIQQKIAQKQMSAMQAKANKRLSNINASSHDDKEMKKGGKEQIVINPPLKEASDLPKAVVSKGHEIAKSLIKHRAKVREPYAVGMAQAKKSAEIKD
jgi:hypothetical protein